MKLPKKQPSQLLPGVIWIEDAPFPGFYGMQLVKLHAKDADQMTFAVLYSALKYGFEMAMVRSSMKGLGFRSDGPRIDAARQLLHYVLLELCECGIMATPGDARKEIHISRRTFDGFLLGLHGVLEASPEGALDGAFPFPHTELMEAIKFHWETIDEG